MMALNTASDSLGDTIIPYYYVPVYFMRRTNIRETLILLEIEHRICQSTDNELPFPLIITAKNPSKLFHQAISSPTIQEYLWMQVFNIIVTCYPAKNRTAIYLRML